MTVPADLMVRAQPLLKNDADVSSRRRVLAILEYLDIQPGERVLDCGCGLGWMLWVISELHDCRLFGVEPDPARLQRAARELGRRAELVRASIAALPFPSGSFDKIVLAEVLEHVVDDLGGLREVGRVLKPGGVVAITVPNREYPFWWDPVNRCRERAGLQPIRSGVFGGIWTNHVRLYGRSEIADLVRAADLGVEAVRGLVERCLPFSHNIVYGVGKPLVESGLLPTADRFRQADRSTSLFSPLAWGFSIVDLIDRLNPDSVPAGRPSVSIAVKGRKPGSVDARTESRFPDTRSPASA
jgi:2-polyprenyl-6-hydroxyphenyl methylase/3-demethylubiquinone-9 3-methyltransferase